jgi:excisionase family DNA binding protein
MTTSSDPLLVNAHVASELLGVSERTLWTLTQTGGLPYVRVGRRVMYSPDSLRAWIAAQEARNARGKPDAGVSAAAS